MSRIGYQHLSPSEKAAYGQFMHAFESYGTHVNNIDRSVDVMKVMQTALGDNPHVIYFDKSELGVMSSLLGNRQVSLRGAVSAFEARRMQTQLETAVKQAVSEIEARCPSSNYEKLMCIYEYLQDRLRYDTQELHTKGVRPMSHNAYGTLLNNTGVCDGISSAFALIAQKMGFDCTLVHGKAAFRTESLSGHAWNLVKVGNAFYHLDLTWDINHKEVAEDYSYEYFCVTDADISANHEWDRTSTPRCSHSDLSFYVRNRCIANTLPQLEEIFARYAKSKQNVVRVKIAAGVTLAEPAGKVLGEKLLSIAASFGRYPRLALTWNADTRCFYAKLI